MLGTSKLNTFNYNAEKQRLRIQHIPSLPDSNKANQLLRRIHSEFETLIQKRGYNVTSITELCCCGDGLEHMIGCSGKRKRFSSGRRKKMPDNVLGYNLTWGRQRHRIHLRLRNPHTHDFYPYEDIAGTMCHELAHCERSPHDAKFYKIMEEIMEQHSIYLAKGLVVDSGGFPINSKFAYVLGGGRGKWKKFGRNAAGEAALQRQKRSRLMNGANLLGSEGKTSLSHLSPREAARIAAERRIKERGENDDLFCLPCKEIIEILEESPPDTDIIETQGGLSLNGGDEEAKKQRVEIIDLESETNGHTVSIISDTSASTTAKPEIIDLESISDDNDISLSFPQSSTHNAITKPKSLWTCPVCTFKNDTITSACEVCGVTQLSSPSADCSDLSWSCHLCTFRNKPLALVCDACCEERILAQKDVN